MNLFLNIRRKLLYLAFLLLAGVVPVYYHHKRKKRDREQVNKEAQKPWDTPQLVKNEKAEEL
ncbi:MAG: hypothetical protein AB1458_11285 [Bacteroidota bacterium]